METTTTVMKRATLQEVGASTEEGSKRGRGEGGVMQVWAALHQGRRRRTYDAWSKDLDGLSVNWKHWWRCYIHAAKSSKIGKGNPLPAEDDASFFRSFMDIFRLGRRGRSWTINHGPDGIVPW